MSVQRLSSMAALMILSALAGCAALLPPPEPVLPPTSPTDLLRAATSGDTTAVAITAPTSAHPTLPEFLGIPQCLFAMQRCCELTASQVAFCFPGLAGLLDGFGAVLPLDDPANLSDAAPATVQKAAEIKAQEEQAAQKIAALRYLATIGCRGCYKSVEDAFIAGLDDCTEEVRYEAAKALRDTTTNACQLCNSDKCCSEKIQKKLREMAFETDDSGCPKEPSDRVRRQARLALAECGPPPPAPVEETPPVIEETPDVPAEGPETEEAPPEPVDEEEEAEGPLTKSGSPTPAANATSAAGSTIGASGSAIGSRPSIHPPTVLNQNGSPAGIELPVYPWTIKR
jgi:hypothetical protein